MRALIASLLRNHWHVLLIVPLVIVVMTWPTFARIFDGDEFWLHVAHVDKWLKFWDTWHLERVLAGQADLYYTDAMYHPQGVSLAFQSIVFPHALLFVALKKLMPADDAYNLIFLLILCFNALSAYVLIKHLIKDKWIALFGAVVVGVSVPFPYDSTVPDLILIGTLPLTVYFLRRSVLESRWLFAALAGICAGITAFISLYVFAFILLTVAFYAINLSISRWTRPAFWRQLLLFIVLCSLISALRLYPMVADAAILKEGLGAYEGVTRSNDVMEFFIRSGNPVTGDFLRTVFNVPADSAHDSAYLGYINLLFLGCAILHKPLRRTLIPWITILIFFAVLRLGHYLSFNGSAYTSIVLPERVLSDYFPALFGAIGVQEYYQIGAVIPLAVLSCFGLTVLLRSKPTKVRVPVVLACIVILALEFYAPLHDQTHERNKIAYVDWLQTETVSPIKLINLPRRKGAGNPVYYLYVQTLTGYPHAYGWINRNRESPRAYIKSNLILRRWESSRNVHCLPHNERSFSTALDQLLADGFTHIVVHNWLYGDHYINHSFWSVPKSYDDGFVSVYRLRDLSLSCRNLESALPGFDHFARASWAIPGLRSSILSFHPSESIDADLFAYLDSVFSDWQSLLHLYLDNGEPVMQSAGTSYPDMESFARDNQVVFLFYNSHDTDAAALHVHASFEQFNLCQREVHEDGSVIERYVKREFSCALLTSSKPLQVDYDNGARLENVLVEMDQDYLDVQFMWSNLPSEPHSVSLQIFDAADDKVLGQDSTIGYISLRRRRVDISPLPPGNYVVKLIVYNFNTGHSVSGKVSETSVRFDRELEIKTIYRS